ncbi:hypothetical protein EI555_012754, partial [Monodon monoceros]
ADTYGGCPYHSCNIHEAKLDTTNSLRQSYLFTKDKKGHLFLNIKGPWDIRWAQGIEGKLYRTKKASYPVGAIRVFRSYISLIPKVIQQLSEQATAIQETEQALGHQLPHPKHKEDPFSWLTLVHQAVQILNHTGIVPIFLVSKNLTICYGSRPNLADTGLLCISSLTVNTSIEAPPGMFLWCNGSLTKKINSSSPFPCIPITLIPQLT